MKVTSPCHSDEVTLPFGVCKNLLFSQISGNFGACANSVHQALLSPCQEPGYEAMLIEQPDWSVGALLITQRLRGGHYMQMPLLSGHSASTCSAPHLLVTMEINSECWVEFEFLPSQWQRRGKLA